MPQVDVGAPAPTPIDAALTEDETPYGPTAPTKVPGVSVVSGVTEKAASQNVPVTPEGVAATSCRYDVPELGGTQTKVNSCHDVVRLLPDTSSQ